MDNAITSQAASSGTTQSPFPVNRRFLSPAEFCEALGIGRQSFERLWRSGEIASTKLGGRRLVPVTELARLEAAALASVEGTR